MLRRKSARCRPAMEPLEDRLCMASSLGWDGAGQGSAALTYYIGNAPSSLSQAAVDAAIKTALNAWSSVAKITFTQTSQPNLLRSLDFTFQPIDGAGGALAQGYFPDDVNPGRLAGDVQFDSSERWEVGNSQGSAAFDLVLTAVHEIGHALGLDHSNAAGSVMAPSISANQSFTGLGSTDVAAIRGLYAPAGATTTTTPTTTTTTTTPTTTATNTGQTPTTTPGFRFPRFRFWRYRSAANRALGARLA